MNTKTIKIVGLILTFFAISIFSSSNHLFSNDESYDENCNSDPIIQCPANVWLQPTESIDPIRSGTATATPGSIDCGQPLISYSDEVNFLDVCDQVITRTWTAMVMNSPDLEVSCVQTITKKDDQSPTFSILPDDITIYASSEDTVETSDCSNRISWDPPIASDNHILESITTTTYHEGKIISLRSGDFFPTGLTTVQYTAQDFCGNSTSYTLSINVLCFDCHLVCPEVNINTATVDYINTTLPSPYPYDNKCGSLISLEYEDENQENDCLGDKQISRVWYGVFEDDPNTTYSCIQKITMPSLSIYHCPDNLNIIDNYTVANWEEPVAVASDNASVITMTSNYPPGQTFPIGTTMVTYTAQDVCGNTEECSFTVSVLNDATYSDCPEDIIVEIEEDNVAVVDYNLPVYNGTCNKCPQAKHISGFNYMGSYDGSDYYSYRKKASYHEAKKIANTHNGHLASINSKEENEFIAKNIFTRTALIGLTDESKEGKFVWDDNSSLTYKKWYLYQPNDYNNQDYVEIIKNTGQWNDIDNNSKLEFVMEIPCSNVKHLSGPTPGAHIEAGNHEVTYQIADGCGMKKYCTFNILVTEGIQTSSSGKVSGNNSQALSLESTIDSETRSNSKQIKSANVLADANDSSELDFYPNPVSDLLYININNSDSELQLINIHGQLVIESQKLTRGENVIDMTNLETNTYILLIEKGNKIQQVKRLVKI